jgi:membrane protein YdbS with pleckstrin-like domain
MESSFDNADDSPAEPSPLPEAEILNTTDPQAAYFEDPAEPMSSTGGLADQAFLPIDSRQITLDRINGLIISACLIVGYLVGLVSYYFSISEPDWIFWAVNGGSLLFLLAIGTLSFVWPPTEFRHTSWRLMATGLEIRRGVFWKHQISIPSSRVQHVDVSQGPLQRNFGIGTLTIHTAGTSNASVELAGLAFETATALRDQLVAQREALNVV